MVASKTTGTEALITDGEDGLLFDLDDPAGFHRGIDRAFADPAPLVASAARKVSGYSIGAAAAPVKALYEELLDRAECA